MRSTVAACRALLTETVVDGVSSQNDAMLISTFNFFSPQRSIFLFFVVRCSSFMAVWTRRVRPDIAGPFASQHWVRCCPLLRVCQLMSNDTFSTEKKRTCSYLSQAYIRNNMTLFRESARKTICAWKRGSKKGNSEHENLIFTWVNSVTWKLSFEGRVSWITQLGTRLVTILWRTLASTKRWE